MWDKRRILVISIVFVILTSCIAPCIAGDNSANNTSSSNHSEEFNATMTPLPSSSHLPAPSLSPFYANHIPSNDGARPMSAHHREPFGHEMPMNDSEHLLPPHLIPPERNNFTFDYEPPPAEGINESPQASSIEKTSSKSMEIGNETIWKDETRILNENLIINSTGNLTLINTTLIMNCQYYRYHIEVQNGGEMRIFGSTITSMNPDYEYYFQVNDGSKFEMRDSELHECGFYRYGYPWYTGLRISTNDTIIENNLITNNHHAIYFNHSSNNTLANNTCSNNNYGIDFDHSSNNTLTNNTCLNNHFGIRLRYSSGNTLTNNTCNLNTRYGISLESSNNNILTNNIVNSNNESGIDLGFSSNNILTNNSANLNNYYGIYLQSSGSNTLSSNTMSGNTYNFGVLGNSLPYFIQDVDTNNKVDGKPIYYWVNQQDQQLPSDAGFVGVVNSTNITVKDLTLTNNSYGVLFISTTNSNIENVSVSDNARDGIYLRSSSNNILTNNCCNLNNYDGINLYYYSSNNILTNNTCNSNNYDGINLGRSSNNILTNNSCSNNKYGIYLGYYSSSNILTNNSCNLNTRGIYLTHSSSNTLISNIMSGNRLNFGVYGEYYSHFSQNIDTSNKVDGKPIYYWVNQQDQQIPNDAGFVGIIKSTNITVRDLTLTNNYEGILFAFTTNSNIENVNASGNGYGIYLYSSSGNTLTNNTCSNGGGIYLYSSSGNTLTNNTCSNGTGIVLEYYSSNNILTNNTCLNNGAGIYLKDHSRNNILTNNTCNSNYNYGIYLYKYSSSNTLTNNICSNNRDGIYLGNLASNNILTNNTCNSNGEGIRFWYSSSNILTNNTCSNNGGGIDLGYSSSNNILTNNTCSNNGGGIYLGWDSSNNTIIYNNIINSAYYGAYISESPNNYIHHNNFIENGYGYGNAQAYDEGTNNHWNDINKGNYWSDYTTRYPSATNNGVVWDTPYVIDGYAGAADNYPLVNPVVANTVIYGHRPSGALGGPVGSMTFYFSKQMNDTSFSIDDDIVSFTGPEGDITITGYLWTNASTTLEVFFEPQATVGSYELVIGPHILDSEGNAMDQDWDQIPGEVPDDLYVASFIIVYPRVLSHIPSAIAPPPISSISFNFDRAMDEASFSLTDDIVSFTGPNGSVIASGYSWSDSHTLEVTFGPQYTLGEYEMVIGPEILDVAGNAMDQDGDLIPGEVPEDRYTATFELVNVLYWSGDITEDTIWNYPIIVVDGSVDVASGVTLTIEPGTIVKFSVSSSGINVQGSLDVPGTPEHPVIMTSSRDDTAGGDTNEDGDSPSPAAGDWQGLTFDSATAVGTLENIQIRYANKGVYGTVGGASIELHNCVLRDGNYGVYVYTPYVETELDNCLIVNNRLTGVFVRASSSHVLRNCNILGNGFQGSGWTGAGVHLGAATLTLDNTIVAFNHNGMHHSGSTPSVVVRNSDFYNPAGYEISGWTATILEGNGNIKADPLFIDREAGNYELDACSPCIDSGRGIGAPSEDFLGRSRYDDPGMPNVGTGYPSYVDMGAFERQEDTAAGDLAVTYVSNPDPMFVRINDTFTVEWTAVNRGLLNCPGPWHDKVYLSNDSYISPDDLTLATRIHNGTLSPGDVYTEMLTATVPSTSGPKYILIHTNADYTFPEADATNNVGAAWQVLAVDVPLLQLDAPVTGTLAPEQWNFYRFVATTGNTVLFNLDAEAVSGSTGIYLRYSLPPTISQYDVAGVVYSQPDQDAKLLMPLEGTYYVGIYGKNLPGGATDYTLSARLTDLGIESVSPNVVGNVGNATIEIVGDNFLPDDEIYFFAPDEVIQLAPLEVYYVDPSHVFATFNLTTADIGVYDVVVVTAESEIATLKDAVQVTVGGGPDFHASLSMPGIARPGRVIDVRVDYANNGNSDITSPLLTLIGPEDCQWQAPNSGEWVTGPKFRLMALSTSGPANILRANQSESIEVTVRVPVSGNRLRISLNSLGARPEDGSEERIDWSNWFPPTPNEKAQSTRENIVTHAAATFGTTYQEYIHSLGSAAAELAAEGYFEYSAAALEDYILLTYQVGSLLPESLDLLHKSAEIIVIPFDEYERPFDPLKPVKLCYWNSSIPDFMLEVPKDIKDPSNGTKLVVGEKWELWPCDQNWRGKNVILLEHGWRNEKIKEWETVHQWVTDMAQRLENTGNGNIMLVNWEKEAGGAKWDPFTPARRIPDVADDAYEMLKDNVTPTQLHIIGHSHGAHLAGMIGNRFNGDVKQITAIEPSEESSHAFSIGNWFGEKWGYKKRSAQFIDEYKSSRILGGEFAWGNDCLRLVTPKRWDDHGYAHKWYTSTITDSSPTNPSPGFHWDKDSWNSLISSNWIFRNGDNNPWKGIIDGPQSKIICAEIGMGKDEWNYPGTWYTCDESLWKGKGHFLFDLAASTEYEVIDVVSPNGTTWKAADYGTITFTVRNNADNRAIPIGIRTRVQSDKAKRDLKFWLSQDDKKSDGDDDIWLNVLITDPKIITSGVTVLNYIGAVGDPEDCPNSLDISYRVVLPSLETINKTWGNNSLRDGCYIVVQVAADWEWELYPNNNSGSVWIEIENESLVAEAGPDQISLPADDTGYAISPLNPIGSAPEELIDRYVWTEGGATIAETTTMRTVSHPFAVGVHTVTLTVYALGDPDTPTDDKSAQDTIQVHVYKPPPEGPEEGSGSSGIYTSYTPEDKFGPGGYDASDTPEGGEMRYIPAGQTMDYRIEFWNKEDAPVPTQDAVIEDTLDPNVFDFSTFEFTRIGFLKWDMPLPGGQTIDTRVDCRPEMDIAVEVTATFDPDSGNISWWFHCIDPLTGDWPEDPMAGFLPPFNPDTGFEIGWVEFNIKPKADLPSGAQIPNQAFVEFDFAGDINDHPAPKEGPWINTIDAAQPASNMTAVLLEEKEIQLNWAGEDDVNGSGIKDYTIYVSDDGAVYTSWLVRTINTSAVLKGESGHTYAFYSVARDNVGNVEEAPEEPDATVVCPSGAAIFDTKAPTNPYPSIAGTHNGTITPSCNISVSRLYTYSCAGTGGHTESIELYENETLIANGTWNGYVGDWHNITITPSVTLWAGRTYNYTIVTGSYPQIHHTDALPTDNGWINCTKFTDANGKEYNDWIPAIKLE